MKCLVYASRALVPFDPNSLIQLAHTAAYHNHKNGISGYLHYRRGAFFQYIEGEEQSLDALLARIRNDERHQITNEVELSSSSSPRFPDWSMRFLSDDALRRVQLEELVSSQLSTLLQGGMGLSRIRQSLERLLETMAARYAAGREGLFDLPRYPPR